LLDRLHTDFPNSKYHEPALYHLAMAYFLNNGFKKAAAAMTEYQTKFPH